MKQEVFTAIDPKTGRPSVDESKKPAIGKTVTFCPSHWGGKDWPPAAWNPKTTTSLYSRAREPVLDAVKSDEKRPDMPRASASPARMRRRHAYSARGCETHRRVAGLGSRYRQEGLDVRLSAHQLGTGAHDWGRAVFAGVRATACSAHSMHAGQGAVGIPCEFRRYRGAGSYMVDGVQYIAVQAGLGVDAQKMITRLDQTMKTRRTCRRAA